MSSLPTIRAVAPTREPLRMWGQPADAAPLEWPWVEERLAGAGTYWVVARSAEHPHPRPVWGVWHATQLLLSIGSPLVAGALEADPAVTVHLGSDLDVVVVEGHRTGTTGEVEDLARYNAKYDWDYTVEQYGPLTVVTPSRVLAWRCEGWAGKDGVKQAARWRF